VYGLESIPLICLHSYSASLKFAIPLGIAIRRECEAASLPDIKEIAVGLTKVYWKEFLISKVV